MEQEVFSVALTTRFSVNLLRITCQKAFSFLVTPVRPAVSQMKTKTPKEYKLFNQAEEVGSQITYRCITCRECEKCKNHDSHEAVSLKEETEQAIINSSVEIDLTTRIATAKLPFISDPQLKLAPNKTSKGQNRCSSI